MDEQVLFTEVKLKKILQQISVLLAKLFCKGSSNIADVGWVFHDSVLDFLWEIKTEIIDGLSFKYFLSLVELFSHELVEVIIEDEVLKLGELH